MHTCTHTHTRTHARTHTHTHKVSLLLPVFELVFSELIADTATLIEQQIFKCDFNQVGVHSIVWCHVTVM